MLTAAPGPASMAWSRRFAAVAAPMGPRAAPAGAAATVVYREAQGANVIDMDGNRYVDLAAGFGSLLLGHRPARVLSALSGQAQRLLQSLGDVHPSEVKIRLLERLVERVFGGAGQAILGQSGADAMSAALKTAVLHTGKPGVVAFSGAYHGLSYGPLPLCGLRESYRAPFAAQLNPNVRFVDYPGAASSLDATLSAVRKELLSGDVGAVVFEPILGRGGCLVPPAGFARELGVLCREHSSLLVADEIWTGLGRSGHWLFSRAQGADPDLVCLGKGLGGGLPLSACVGKREVMAAWSRADEVVHTSTFAGAPLGCASALALLDVLEEGELVARSRRVGQELASSLAAARPARASAGFGEVQGSGLMLAVQVGAAPGSALELAGRLLQAGYIVSLGGGRRESIVLTPALDIPEALLQGFVHAFAEAARSVSA
jgi:4-aminobutyrate aminotransferase / (S)-3-amino-2-methylpropionate transaminase / 5-aminovalerate transaminase